MRTGTKMGDEDARRGWATRTRDKDGGLEKHQPPSTTTANSGRLPGNERVQPPSRQEAPRISGFGSRASCLGAAAVR